MKTHTPSYRGYWFPSEITSHAIWLHHRFCLSFCKVKKLWIAEAEGRFHELQEGVVQGISASEIFSELPSKRS